MNSAELHVKMKRKLAGWKSNTLSRGGKITLLKDNLSRMSNHVLSCFKCPSTLTSKMDKECRNFFWGSTSTNLISWSQVCLPKQKGGLGVRSFAVFNNAPLCKLAWKIH